MHSRKKVFSLVGSLALALLASCATTSQQPPAGDPVPPPEQPPASGTGSVQQPEQPSEPNGTPIHSWDDVRVGDRLVYAFSANRAPSRGVGETGAVAGRLTLEVMAVDQGPYAVLKLTFTDEAGKPLASPRLSKELILPIKTFAPLRKPRMLPHEGTSSVEQLSAAGQNWEAVRYIQDNRPADGPLEERLYAVKPGPLYITHGLLSASTTLSGFGARGGQQLTLVEARRGPEGGGKGTPPLMRHPLGPGAWYDIRTDLRSDTRERICFSAELGFILRGQSTVKGTPHMARMACEGIAETEVVPLEEALLTLIAESLSPHLPKGEPTSRAPHVFADKRMKIPALTFDVTQGHGGAGKGSYVVYAENPWDEALVGLPLEARFRPLADASGDPEAAAVLVDWGVIAGSEYP
ncbi:DUF6068 family protein [Hyalangium gracile]|uniref:DUF6068 family protein n=1 Tax=Hyalangium gracile TaxID=394092 RepID=UPI001CCD1522|nr:DUF6068 family protein [Hyalangium gracile]